MCRRPTTSFSQGNGRTRGRIKVFVRVKEISTQPETAVLARRSLRKATPFLQSAPVPGNKGRTRTLLNRLLGQGN